MSKIPDLAQMKAIFARFDSSNDGNLDGAEMMKIFIAIDIKISQEEFDCIFS